MQGLSNGDAVSVDPCSKRPAGNRVGRTCRAILQHRAHLRNHRSDDRSHTAGASGWVRRTTQAQHHDRRADAIAPNPRARLACAGWRRQEVMISTADAARRADPAQYRNTGFYWIRTRLDPGRFKSDSLSRLNSPFAPALIRSGTIRSVRRFAAACGAATCARSSSRSAGPRWSVWPVRNCAASERSAHGWHSPHPGSTAVSRMVDALARRRSSSVFARVSSTAAAFRVPTQRAVARRVQRASGAARL